MAKLRLYRTGDSNSYLSLIANTYKTRTVSDINNSWLCGGPLDAPEAMASGNIVSSEVSHMYHKAVYRDDFYA